jgi:transposase-like protein
VAELSRQLGVSEGTLRSWRRQEALEHGQPEGPSTDERSLPREPEREYREEGTVQRWARLTAGTIEVGIAVLSAPARWTADCLRWYADRRDEPVGGATVGRDRGDPRPTE